MKFIIKYLSKHWLFASVVAYVIFSCILKITAGINITIPCLFKTFFGLHCPGCGLTSAFIELLQLHPRSAWDHNPLIFIVLPVAAICLIRDLMRFNKRMSKPAFSN